MQLLRLGFGKASRHSEVFITQPSSMGSGITLHAAERSRVNARYGVLRVRSLSEKYQFSRRPVDRLPVPSTSSWRAMRSSSVAW